MRCPSCGADSPKNIRFCTECGSAIQDSEENKEKLVGFSSRINDPMFSKYIKNTKRWALIFAFVLAFIVVVSFYLYGEISSEMENPEAVSIGMGIGGMFIGIAMLKSTGINNSITWDGLVVDKKIERKRRKRHSGNDMYWETYTLYTVFIRSSSGKIHTSSAEDDDTVFNYYQNGDMVRHHGSLNSYEKYDKSKDDIIFCNACASLNDIRDDTCFRCRCPLLKGGNT